MRVIIRVDSSSEIGTGHVMRCLTLANQLCSRGAVVSFISRDLKGNMGSIIIKSGFDLLLLPNIHEGDGFYGWYDKNWKIDQEETKTLIKDLNYRIDLLIVDHYGLDHRWEKGFVDITKKLMVIDDLADRAHHCDFLLDQNYCYQYETRYNHLLTKPCTSLLGPQYVLLRPEFREARRLLESRNGVVNKILVFFGGSDPTNETLKAIEAISEINRTDIKVDVVVGESNPNKDQIRAYCEQRSGFSYYCQISHMAELMVNADLAIGAGGSTTWERCYLGLPSLTIITADNQMELTSAVDNYGATKNLGLSSNITVKSLTQDIKNIVHKRDMLMEMSNKAMELVGPTVDNDNEVAQIIMGEID
jgi:UDP-2,4-diacetamido-2,4,6-trideoxy-beta-L-altropyranose hydrolase